MNMKEVEIMQGTEKNFKKQETTSSSYLQRRCYYTREHLQNKKEFLEFKNRISEIKKNVVEGWNITSRKSPRNYSEK